MTIKFSHALTFMCITAIFICACNSTAQKQKKRKIVVPDLTITPKNAFINIFMDSAAVAQVLKEKGFKNDDSISVVDFYRARNYQYAWFDSVGLAEQAGNFMNLYQNFAAANPGKISNPELDSVMSKLVDDSSYFEKNKVLILPTELMLTAHFFKYAQLAYAGDEDLDVKDLGWYIPRKKIDPTAFLDSIIANKGRGVETYEPMHPLYSQLKGFLEKYADIEKNGGWKPIPFEKKSYRLGDTAMAIALLKKRLQLVGDLEPGDTGIVFTKATKIGVAKFQQRYGLKEDSIAASAVLSEMNEPVSKRIRQIMINMERSRWIPRPGKGAYVLVNIPAYKMYVFEGEKVKFSMNAVVGSTLHNTVIFNGQLETIAFSPYWNVPYSITKNEMGRTAAYFSKRNMEIIGRYSDGLPIVRQKPGPSNALGGVKFLFPNSYSIYMHDTPSKNLFNETKRAFSHGCIRLGEPAKFAQYLLAYDPKWTVDSINKAMHRSTELQIKIKDKVPVFIGYFTAWVDGEGRLNFRDDLYGHDKKMGDHLFTKN